MNRTLLIPIDFSNASKIAVRFALSNEYQKGDKIILLHCYRLISDDSNEYRDEPRKLKLLIEQKLQHKYEEFSKSLNLPEYGASIDFIMKVGFITNCIHAYANERKIDLVIYGLKCDKSNHELIDLIKAGDCSVELVPETFDFDRFTPSNKKTTTQSDFASKSEYYLNEAYAHPNAPYLVVR